LNALQQQVERGVEVLRAGGVIVFPTDTVYGLGADAFNPRAVRRVYEVKRRSADLALPLLLGGLSQVDALAEAVPGFARFMAERFWPGGLTIVLPKSVSLPSHLGRGATVAVRVPRHAVALDLISRLGRPLVGTSANISGEPSVLTADEARKQLGSEVELIIDGGKCPGGVESTIIDATGEVPVVLRRGMITEFAIGKAYEDYCGERCIAYRSRL
jgi:L-threonylcarbamoyladenylate synthase